ncbi:uncharacterized protein LOC112458984 [Temnothorax curvispinosus]|uniref:Uncharacterized protein LOC112458984 n=1 Tax=Temnothorax curvispinosus TaxID=300111 RepID=A0A6J1QAE5_9HYME|nr:uncharacterized protein LOC112458984 [Temnothorax curvispinosus]
MDLTEQQYIIEGVIYNITTTSEMHKRIRNDHDFALQYVRDNIHTSSHSSQLEFQSESAIENNSNIENIPTSESDANNATMEHSGTWQNSAIKLIFCLYKDHLTLFKNDKIRNEIVWRKIGDGLKEKGYSYTIKQIENKWKN